MKAVKRTPARRPSVGPLMGIMMRPKRMPL
jgi:hypothetical protein